MCPAEAKQGPRDLKSIKEERGRSQISFPGCVCVAGGGWRVCVRHWLCNLVEKSCFYTGGGAQPLT